MRNEVFTSNSRGARTWLLATAAALLLSGCTPKAQKAAQWEALSDEQMSIQAYPAAVFSLQNAVKYNSNDPNVWIKLARAQRMANQIGLSATAYQRAVDLQPDNIEALQALAVMTVRAGQFENAKHYVETLLALSPNDIGGTLATGAIALFEDRLDDAMAAAEKLIASAPSLGDGPILKARVLDARGDTRGAAALLGRRMAIDMQSADVAGQALLLYRKLGDRTGIQNASLILARLVPNDPRYQLEAARAQRARGDKTGAADTLAALSKRYAANPQVIQAVAWQIRETLPPTDAAARIAELAGQVSPRSRATLATMLVDMGEERRALALTDAVAAQPIDAGNAEVKTARAAALLAMGRGGEAREVIGKVLEFDGSDSTALLVRSREARARHDYPSALNDAQRAFDGAPNNADAALLIARLYGEQGQAMLATKAFGDAQARFPDDFRIHAARIDWLLGAGDVVDASRVATGFARAHPRSLPAWRLADTACSRADDAFCAGEARSHLGRG